MINFYRKNASLYIKAFKCTRNIMAMVFCLCPFLLNAQTKSDVKKSVFITPAYESLYSTHGNFFYSASIQAEKKINSRSTLGVGIESAYTAIHHDNGFVLYNLRFIPVYLNAKHHFKTASNFTPFVELSAGISFNKYQIATDEFPTNKSVVHETGLYLYGGTGIKYKLFKNVEIATAVGLKGYKMSFNDLDINPHGVTYLLGFCYTIN